MINPLPASIIRLSADSISLLTSENGSSVELYINHYLELFQYKINLKKTLMEFLYLKIKTHHTPETQRYLLNLKRSVYNDKIIRLEKIQWIDKPELSELKRILLRYLSITEDINRITNDFNSHYPTLRRLHMKQLIKLSDHRHLSNGLLLSSTSLLKRLDRYREKGVSQSINKNTVQTENSLIKYLSRMLTKTSPFSSFSQTAGALWVSYPKQDKQWFNHAFEFNPSVIHSHIQLNNYLWAYLKILLNTIPELCRNVSLCINPSLTLDNQRYQFLINSQNLESVQTLAHSDAIELILTQLTKHLSFNKLLAQLLKESTLNASQTEIEDYLEQLINIGLLQYDWQVSGSDKDWDKQLIENLTRFDLNDHPGSQLLICTLNQLRTKIQTYAQLTTPTLKLAQLDSIFTTFKALCQSLLTFSTHSTDHSDLTHNHLSQTTDIFKQLKPTTFAFKPAQMIYEDNVHPSLTTINASLLTPLLNSLDTLLNKLYLFDEKAITHLELNHVYQSFEGQSAIDFLNFYQAYYTFKKAKQAQANEFIIPEIKAFEQKRIDWLSEFIDKLPFKTIPQTINLTVQMLDQINTQVKLNPADIQYQTKKAHGYSYGAFIQPFFTKQGSIAAVLNGVSSGYGKLFSRFLGSLDNTILESIKQHNSKQCFQDSNINSFWAENTDASFFNANLHPAIMPFEIRIPDGHNQLPHDKQIELLDLEVKPDEFGKIGLFHKSLKRQVYIFDLGLQNAENRAPSFELLSHFNHGHQYNYAFLIKAIHDKCISLQKNRPVIYLPRVSFEKNLVLSRTQWVILNNYLPLKPAKTPESSYMLTLNEWRSQHLIPDKVFVRIPKAGETIKSDDYKPQYIDFYNPFFVNLFGHLAKKVSHILIIEEMLPKHEQLISIKGKPYVSEVIVQWQNNA